jgi:methyltransferase (TIGR00027 family)
MHEAKPSATALRVALRRAAHQDVDAQPLVFPDPLAKRILPPEAQEELKRTPDAERRPFSAALRAWMVVRARFAEDVLASGVHARGVCQALVLGAGLDTFAYRNPYPDLRVFEVDHPATQAWKRDLLEASGIAVPSTVHFAPVDFERDQLDDELTTAEFDWSTPTATAWLGVVPYLTREAFTATLRILARCARGSSVVFDYGLPREVLGPTEQLMRDSMSARVAQAGEPFRLFFTPETLAEQLAACGLRVVEDVGSAELVERYFTGRWDGLTLRGRSGRLCHAEPVR